MIKRSWCFFNLYMKSIVVKYIVVILFLFGIFSINVNAQDGECDVGGCSGGTLFPVSEQSTTSDTWTIVSTLIYAGEYAVYNVTLGETYEWSLCSADGGSSSYDSELTLLSEDGLTKYCYSDDICDLNAKIGWTATFTGKVRVLVNQWDCQPNTTFTTLVWRCISCGSIVPPTNDECTGAVSLTVFSGGTCGGATDGDILGATDSGLTSCYGTANNDVWFSFVATSANFHNVSVIGSSDFDAVIDLREGPSCSGTNIACSDNTGIGGEESISMDGLILGQTYFVRVYDYFSSVPESTDFTICVTAPEVCTPSYSSGTDLGDYIDGVELVGENATSISNTSSGGGTPYIKDYTAQSVDLKASFSYSLILTNGEYDGQTLAAWIDYNDDGIYTTNEKLGEYSNSDATQIVVIDFTVPADATLGATEMLVRSVWSDADIDPCSLYSFGEAEIYSVDIITPCVTPGIPTSLTESSIDDDSAIISWTAGTPAGSTTVTYYWAIGAASNVTYESNYIQRGSGTSLTVNLSSLDAGTQYYWTVKAVTSCNSSASNYASVSDFTTTCITPGVPSSLSTTSVKLSVI